MQFTIRPAAPADADACAAVHVAAWEGSYRGIMPDEEFEKRPLSARQLQWRALLSRTDGKYRTLVACGEGGDILGFAGAQLLNGEAPFDSYLAMLYLRPDVKGCGLGKVLLLAAAREMQTQGAQSMALRTLRLNPARKFYERLSARLVPEGMDFHAGVFDDVVYAFDDLNALIASDRSSSP